MSPAKPTRGAAKEAEQQPEVKSAGPSFGQWLARALLAGFMLLVIQFFIRICYMAYADYSFHTMTAPPESNPTAVRLAYAKRLERLLDLDPGNSEIRAHYAKIQSALGDPHDAAAELERAMQTQRSQNSLYFLAQMYEKTDPNFDRAEATLKDAVVLNPNEIESNQALLRLMNRRLAPEFKAKSSAAANSQARAEFTEAATNWVIRAADDPNAWMFMGNAYVDTQHYLQAYRSYLVGLSQLQTIRFQNSKLMVESKDALKTINQILPRYAPQYRGLP